MKIAATYRTGPGEMFHKPLVYTVRDRCRVCFTCVRECPVKAIRIMNGQAEVIHERCIGCGNCVKVCSQGAKTYRDSREEVCRMLSSREKVAACLAPSFPAEFTDIADPGILAGMLRSMGFDLVTEVAFGADLVASRYGRSFGCECGNACISSDCPAIVNYIRKYHPGLVQNLVKVASPVMAMARVLRERYGNDTKVVFIGPCIAKKDESDEVDAAITFRELRELFEEKGIVPSAAHQSPFDPPHPGKGSVFPVSRGLLQTVNTSDDLSKNNIVVAEGRMNFRDAVSELEKGMLASHHLELLCCEGCIMGPGMTGSTMKYARQASVGSYVRNKMEQLDYVQWQAEMQRYSGLDLSRQFSAEDCRLAEPSEEEISQKLKAMGKNSEKDMLNCGACGYDTCREHAAAILNGLAEVEMCLPSTIENLHNSIEALNSSNEKLESARQALRQSEKLASMGQLSAGIAHELNNPLGVITMYSNLLLEETPAGNPWREDLQLIVNQTERCRSIVGGLLNFARKNQVRPVRTNVPEFIRECIDSVVIPANVIVDEHHLSPSVYGVFDADQMMQVLTNLIKNSSEAMPEGGHVSITTAISEEGVDIIVADDGHGIGSEHMDKIFTPFFTTKGIGKGTGLGLPLVYGIVKMHKGQISVESNADPKAGPTGTTFRIKIPGLLVAAGEMAGNGQY